MNDSEKQVVYRGILFDSQEELTKVKRVVSNVELEGVKVSQENIIRIKNHIEGKNFFE